MKIYNRNAIQTTLDSEWHTQSNVFLEPEMYQELDDTHSSLDARSKYNFTTATTVAAWRGCRFNEHFTNQQEVH